MTAPTQMMASYLPDSARVFAMLGISKAPGTDQTVYRAAQQLVADDLIETGSDDSDFHTLRGNYITVDDIDFFHLLNSSLNPLQDVTHLGFLCLQISMIKTLRRDFDGNTLSDFQTELAQTVDLVWIVG